MRSTIFSLLFGLAGLALLPGCSSKPSASDVEPNIKSNWENCNLVKVTKIVKTSGVDRGDSVQSNYLMSITYTLEVTRDLQAVDIWDSEMPNPTPNDASTPAVDNQQGNGDSRVKDFFRANCPTTHGENFKRIFGDKKGVSLKNGEAKEISLDYLMITSTNGWTSLGTVGAISIDGKKNDHNFRW